MWMKPSVAYYKKSFRAEGPGLVCPYDPPDRPTNRPTLYMWNAIHIWLGVKHREEKRETNHYKVSMQLVFLHLEREDFMAYQCVCRNTLGIADSVVRLYRTSRLNLIFILFQMFNSRISFYLYWEEIHPVADDGDMNEVYSEADQQDGRGTGKEQLSSTWDG